MSCGGGKKPELLLTWKDGKGEISQNGAARPYTVSAWIPATERFPG